MESASSLPAGAFGSCDRAVESDLSSEAGEVLLRHLARFPDELDAFDALEKACTEQNIAKDDGRNAVPDDELQAAERWFADHALATPPALDTGDFAEFLGVLSDLATHGEGLSRQAASHHLLHQAGKRDAVARIESIDRERMLERLEELGAKDGLHDATLRILGHALGGSTAREATPPADGISPQSALPESSFPRPSLNDEPRKRIAR